MGTIIHDAIVVTSWKEDHAQAARDEAERLGLPVTGITSSWLNGYVSFLIAPDGSKEGWADSDRGEVKRAEWKAWASQQYAKGVYFDWVEVRYGRDMETEAKATDSNNLDAPTARVARGGRE
jgi:hypothetical protein